MTLGSLSRQLYRAHRLNRAVHDPSRYVKNRAIAKSLTAVGFWRTFGRLWR